MDLNEVIRWVLSRGLTLVIGSLVLLVIYRVGRSAIHGIIPSALHAQASHLPTGSTSDDEVEKRIATIEDLLTRLLRLAVIALLVALVLVVFDLWSILAGIVIIVVAITFATQDVVLDYVMGFLILVEGPYFKGDWIKVSGAPAIEGAVEEIGLRRTLLRDSLGSVHAVSNGLIRLSTNVTRVFSVATVEVPVLRAGDVDAAIGVASRVLRELRLDPDVAELIPTEVPPELWVTGMTVDGATLRVQQRVVAGSHGVVANTLRRRLIAAFAAESIATQRWDTPLTITGDPTPGRHDRPGPSVDGDDGSEGDAGRGR